MVYKSVNLDIVRSQACAEKSVAIVFESENNSYTCKLHL